MRSAIFLETVPVFWCWGGGGGGGGDSRDHCDESDGKSTYFVQFKNDTLGKHLSVHDGVYGGVVFNNKGRDNAALYIRREGFLPPSPFFITFRSKGATE